MESRSYAILTGAFTLLFGIALGLTIWWFSGDRKLYNDYLLVTRYSVSGLNVQGSVRYRGLNAGKVDDIRLDPEDPRNILIQISLDRNIQLTKGTIGKLGYQGVTGVAYVLLEDNWENKEPLPKPDKDLPRIPMKPSLFELIADSAEILVSSGGELLKRINNLFDDKNQKRLMKAFDSLGEASREHEVAMKEVPQISAKIKQLLNDENQKKLASMLANLDETSATLAPLVTEYKKLALNMQSLAQKLDNISNIAGEELVAAGPKINALLTELSQNSRNLNRVLEDLERAPQSIIFGKAPPKPGPGEKGFAP